MPTLTPGPTDTTFRRHWDCFWQLQLDTPTGDTSNGEFTLPTFILNHRHSRNLHLCSCQSGELNYTAVVADSEFDTSRRWVDKAGKS
jgi:hypothetical protein